LSCYFLLLPAAMTNLCRDEVTTVLKDKIEVVFGGSFNTNGLGAVLTCGVTGIKAVLSHSPVSKVGAGALLRMLLFLYGGHGACM
jgi:hypothetical protein